jgi:LDH2 family malate/lactate/ureidoglycolate dehydrogenase
MEIPIVEIKRACTAALLKHGLTVEEAEIITNDYLDAEMRGKISHGLGSFSVVLGDCKDRQRATVGMERGPLIFFEGNGDIGHLVAHRAVVWAEGICRKYGFAVAGMKDIKRFASPGTVARRGAEKGMIAMVFEYGGQAFMAPYGAAEPIISTNPVGIGVPREGTPLILDMATSERAFYFIAIAKALGQEIPEHWGIDEGGRPVTDPSKVAAVSPFGGYTGYGLAFMLEVLTGPLLGVDVGLDGNLSRRGALCFFLSPDLFGVDKEAFQARLKRLIAHVKHARTAEGHTEVFLPGEQGERKRSNCLRKGVVEMEEAAYKRLLSLA